jgi:hypothetical protein
MNCGHDSNIERDAVIKTASLYPKVFFNTSIPKFDFPGPVVFTANAQEENSAVLLSYAPHNLMFIRLRASATNFSLVESAIVHYMGLGVPVVLTFMAYYDKEPVHKENYVFKTRHINSYWCPTREFMARVLHHMKKIAGRGVSLCSDLDSYACKNCRNCETYYLQTVKHMKEYQGDNDGQE